MSANEKSKRRGSDEELLKERKFRRNAIIAVICIVLVVAAAIVINSNIFYTTGTAVKIGNTSYTAAEVDVFFRNTYNNIYNSYGSLASYVIDTSKPLNEQNYSEDQTWADYIYSQTLTNMQQVTALCDEANAKGFQLPESDRQEIEDQISSISGTALLNGFANLDRFLSAVYGKGVDTNIFRSVMTKVSLADAYSRSVRETYAYDQNRLDTYYEAHKDELDMFSFSTYFVSIDNASVANLGDDETKKAAAHEAAAVIAEADDPEDFAEKVDAFAPGDAPTERNAVPGSQVSSYYTEYAAWLLDAGREPYDTTVVDTDSGSYVVMFQDRDDNDYATRSMRHILINAEPDENGEYTDAAKGVAFNRIGEIQRQWEADPTEAKFIELANANSEDTGSNTNGGLYEHIYRGQMVPNIDNFLFEEEHKPGDTGLLFGESAAYQGWHMVYYRGEGETYRNYLAGSALRNEDFTAWLDGLTANYPASAGSALRYVHLS